MGMMGLSPAEFWSQSYTEWAARLEGFLEFHGRGNPAPMSRARLSELMKRYPDKK